MTKVSYVKKKLYHNSHFVLILINCHLYLKSKSLIPFSRNYSLGQRTSLWNQGCYQLLWSECAGSSQKVEWWLQTKCVWQQSEDQQNTGQGYHRVSWATLLLCPHVRCWLLPSWHWWPGDRRDGDRARWWPGLAGNTGHWLGGCCSAARHCQHQGGLTQVRGGTWQVCSDFYEKQKYPKIL